MFDHFLNFLPFLLFKIAHSVIHLEMDSLSSFDPGVIARGFQLTLVGGKYHWNSVRYIQVDEAGLTIYGQLIVLYKILPYFNLIITNKLRSL